MSILAIFQLEATTLSHLQGLLSFLPSVLFVSATLGFQQARVSHVSTQTFKLLAHINVVNGKLAQFLTW